MSRGLAPTWTDGQTVLPWRWGFFLLGHAARLKWPETLQKHNSIIAGLQYINKGKSHREAITYWGEIILNPFLINTAPPPRVVTSNT